MVKVSEGKRKYGCCINSIRYLVFFDAEMECPMDVYMYTIIASKRLLCLCPMYPVVSALCNLIN